VAKKAANKKKKTTRKSTKRKTTAGVKRAGVAKKRKTAKKTAKRSKKSRTAKTTKKSTAKRKSSTAAQTNSRPTKARNTSRTAASARKADAKRVVVQDAKPARAVSAQPVSTNNTQSRGTASGNATKTNHKKGTHGANRPSATSQDPIQFPEESKRMPKTPLKKRELNEFRKLLLERRAELAGDVQNLTRDAFSSSGSGFGEHSSMPIHMADRGSDNWEQEFTLGLIENEQTLIREIDEALERIENRTYGICLATLRPINLARLRAKPWAKYCIEYARAREEGRA